MKIHQRPSTFLTVCLLASLFVVVPALGVETNENDFALDARFIERMVDENYAYLERFPGGAMPMTDRLRSEAAAVVDQRSLLRYAERALFLLADHHAITGSSLSDSWAIVPSYADLWIEYRDGVYTVDAVRDASAAWRHGIRAGDVLTEIDGASTDKAVENFWSSLGARVPEGGQAFAARVLVAGRRDRSRHLSVRTGRGESHAVELPSLYSVSAEPSDHLTSTRTPMGIRIRFKDSLGNDSTISAFDSAMASATAGERTVIDLRDTPSGGNTVVARAILGWFVNAPTPYQVHNLPREMKQTGIGRQWIEEVLPRGEGKHHSGPIVVCVGRWTGSMGEGLAIAFNSLGAQVVGDPMAGLLGAVEDYELPHSGLVIKLPTERLFAIDGTPREAFRPLPSAENRALVADLCPAPSGSSQ